MREWTAGAYIYGHAHKLTMIYINQGKPNNLDLYLQIMMAQVNEIRAMKS